MTFEEADRAIRALNNQYIFPGVSYLAVKIFTKILLMLSFPYNR